MLTHQVISDFWILVCEFIGKIQISFPNIRLVLLTDSNGRVGEVKSPMVGQHNKEKENYPGQCFRLCIESNHLKAMNTFFDKKPTWFHIDGTGHRIDYVCLCEALSGRCITSVTHHDLDIAPGGRVDHFAVSADTDLALLDEPISVTKPSKPIKFAINMDQVDSPYKCQQFQDRLWQYHDDPSHEISISRLGLSSSIRGKKPWPCSATQSISFVNHG